MAPPPPPPPLPTPPPGALPLSPSVSSVGLSSSDVSSKPKLEMKLSSLKPSAQSPASAKPTKVSANETSPLQLYIAIRRGRVSLLTAAMVLVLLLMVFTFKGGVELKRITDMEKSPAQQNKLLDDYNAYAGNIGALFGTPVELFVSTAVQVILLRFLTRSITAVDSTWKVTAIKGVVGALSAYLISNGFTAMNVQLRPRGIDPVISADDLSLTSNLSLPVLTTNATHSFPETQPRNPITNTILRNAVFPSVVSELPVCPSRLDVPEADIKFGFRQRDWQTRVLPDALPVKQLRLVVTPTNATIQGGATSADLPMNASLAADLYLQGIQMLTNTFDFDQAFLNMSEMKSRYKHLDTETNEFANNSLAEVVGLLPAPDAKIEDETSVRDFFLRRSTVSLRSQFARAVNTSKSEVNMTFSHVQISDKIGFEAITFEFEIEPMLLADSSTKGNVTRYTNIFRSDACSSLPDQCFIQKILYGSNDFQYDPPAQIKAFGQCVNAAGTQELRPGYFNLDYYPSQYDCDKISNTSMMVFSVGKRVTADVVTPNNSVENDWNSNKTSLVSNANFINLATNLRKFFTVTIGRLSWQLTNLSSEFQAACENADSCLGLQLPLTGTSDGSTQQRLVAGATKLSVPTLSGIRDVFEAPTFSLAIIREPPLRFGGSFYADPTAGDVLLPHNINLRNWTDEPKTWERSCADVLEARINSTRRNHLYNEHGLQPSYTAAVFFLFENAVVRDVIPLNSTATTLNFKHNVRHIAVWLSIPDQSAWLTLAGCILLVVGLAAAMLESATLSKTKSDALSHITAPHVIARVMLDEGQFPPLLLHRHIVTKEDKCDSDMHRKMEGFAIESLVVQHQEDQDRLSTVV